jgi:KDO2-lipid IV(A) lauroyltransferase
LIKVRWLLFKLAFFYPRVYAFSCYYRKKEKRREYEDKVLFFYYQEKDPDRVKKIVKGVFELRGVRKVMRYLIPLMNASFIKRFVKVEGLHHLDQVLKEGRGVVLIAGHIGIPHLSFNALRAMGYNLILLSGVTPKDPKHPKLRYYDTRDNTIFVHDPSLSETYKKRIVETLQAGKILYYDGDAGEGRIKEQISFLGREMDFPTGMAHLAHQAKAAIIPFIHLYQRGKVTLIIKEPIDDHWGNRDRDYKRIMAEFAKLLESYILQYPEQYMGIYGPTVLSEYFRLHGEAQSGRE